MAGLPWALGVRVCVPHGPRRDTRKAMTSEVSCRCAVRIEAGSLRVGALMQGIMHGVKWVGTQGTGAESAPAGEMRRQPHLAARHQSSRAAFLL